MNRPYKQQRGISLASVLIGLAISSGLTLSLTQTFIMAKQSYQMATNLNDMNARALDVMDIFSKIYGRAGEGVFQGSNTNNPVAGSIVYDTVSWGNNGSCTGTGAGNYGDVITTNMFIQTPTWVSPAGISYNYGTNVQPYVVLKGACPSAMTQLNKSDPHTLLMAVQADYGGTAAPLVTNVDFLSELLGEMDHNAGVSRWIQDDRTQSNGYNIDYNRIIAVKVAFALRSRDEILKTPAANVPLTLFPRDYTNSATTGQLCYCPDAGYCPCSGTATIPDRRLRKVYSRTFYLKSFNAPKRPPFCAISSIGQGKGRWVMKTGGVYTATNTAGGYGTNWTTPDVWRNIHNVSTLSSGETLQWATNGAERCALRYTTYNSVPQANQLTVNVQPSADTTWQDPTQYFCRTWGDASSCMSALQSQFPTTTPNPNNPPGGLLPDYYRSPFIPGQGMNILNLY